MVKTSTTSRSEPVTTNPSDVKGLSFPQKFGLSAIAVAAVITAAPTLIRTAFKDVVFGGEGSFSDYHHAENYGRQAALFQDIATGRGLRLERVFPELNRQMLEFSNGNSVTLYTAPSEVGVHALILNSDNEALMLTNSQTTKGHEGKWEKHQNPKEISEFRAYFSTGLDDVTIVPPASADTPAVVQVKSHTLGSDDKTIPMTKIVFNFTNLANNSK